MHSQIDELQAYLDEREVNRETIARIADRSSPDLATLILASYLAGQEANAHMQLIFAVELNRILASRQRMPLDVGEYGSYVILFAPGWLYRSDPTTGADFRPQRDILDRRGIRTVLI